MDRSQLPTCSTFQSDTGADCWNGLWLAVVDDVDEMDTTDEDIESVMPPLLLLRTTTPPEELPSGETTALLGVDRIEPLESNGRPSEPTG